MCSSDLAPINPEVIEFFQALGIKLWEGWGMTETSVGATYNPLTRIKNGTVGIADPGVEVRIAEDGEVLVRGGNVMKGYYKDPEKTAETIDADGWLHTGDVGALDSEGYLRIIDRKKELIITAGGKNISPANLEALLKQHPLVGQACVIGDRRPYVSALIVLDAEAAPVWARKAGIAFTSLADLAQHPAVQAEIQEAVDECNRHVSNVEGVKRFTILPVEWTPESEELTPTLKLKRRVVAQKYAGEIEGMYRREEQARCWRACGASRAAAWAGSARRCVCVFWSGWRLGPRLRSLHTSRGSGMVVWRVLSSAAVMLCAPVGQLGSTLDHFSAQP